MFLETFAKYAFAGRIPKTPKTPAPLTGVQRMLRIFASKSAPTPWVWDKGGILLAKKLSQPRPKLYR